jgi:hypothetical protein
MSCTGHSLRGSLIIGPAGMQGTDVTESQPGPRHSVRETDRRYCPQCQAPMDLAPNVPGLGHLAGRIFECTKCGYAEIVPE